jgi:lantibiotic biosynthesis protein
MPSDSGEFLEAAAQLAERIADSAIWFEDRCNWIAARPDTLPPGGPSAAYSALGPDLYGGTSGIALFLAEAAVTLDDARLRTTALGAIDHALSHAGRVESGARDGLYGGLIGIAYAAVRVAHGLDAPRVSSGAHELLSGWDRDGTRSTDSEITHGLAGAVTGLVAISELLPEPWLLDRAVELGDELASRAEVADAGWSWPGSQRPAFHNLCGYSHGAAGIAHAFVELYAVSGEARFRHAGERAFDYERSWLDPANGTWPDLRGVTRGVGRDAPLPTAGAWCSGAAGIAVSRLRATTLLGSEVLRSEADLALATCAGELTDGRLNDFSLCHGVAGIADALLHADGREDLRRQARTTGRQGIRSFLEDGFPCGVLHGETPALLLGFAGIGMFYLRLANSAVPSPLLVRPRMP